MGKHCLVFTYILLHCCVYLLVDTTDESPFKIGKVNVVWNKARQVLKGKRLTDLYADLVIQDKREKELKKQKFDGKDKFGLFEADVRQGLVEIIKKYGLSEYFPNERYSEGMNEKRSRDKHYQIKDDRLVKILKNARKEGFTDTEIQLLKEELGHHQLKLDEYNSLKLDYEVLEDQVDNSLENLDEQEKLWSELAQKKKDMKDKHKQFREGLKRLENQVTDRDNSAGVFEDPRVYKLWALALKAGMNEAELESVRKELTHFENRIRKAEYIQSQLEKSEQKQNSGVQVDEKEHEELRQKANQINKKVDKYHKDLEERIHKHIDEL
ncbi:alpha-2-macroglobulin receptor-associated protein-like [Mercenaria mercenaria]|uniref:alpha-2-macroglobulin receptor-associated protein-like n=1 Tax=Mercenaria mercenaria TaxID=6596 RepID=UPI00234F7E8C|nr:alpha-2-macroglobulin receptor-associated protein-like [Mercenaria mercenaria]